MRCPNCRLQLIRGEKEYYCPNNHRFDIARSGYVNLLLNQPGAGDNKMMVAARKVIHNQGYFQKLLDAIITILKNYQIESLLDLGCGEGYYSRNIKNHLDIEVFGVDISKLAIDAAAKQAKDVTYLVGNIYNLPFDDQAVDAVINIFAPFSDEVKRVLKKLFIKVEPGPLHLIELKALIYDNTIIKDDKDVITGLQLLSQSQLTYNVNIKEVDALLKMTPFYYRAKIDNIGLDSIEVTMDFRITIYQK